MEIESRSKQYGTIFQHWIVGKCIDRSVDGTGVFPLHRVDRSSEVCTLIVVNLTEEPGVFADLPETLQREYLHRLELRQDQALQELQKIRKLEGSAQTVVYLEHTFYTWSDPGGYGCDLLVRVARVEDLHQVRKVCQGIVKAIVHLKSQTGPSNHSGKHASAISSQKTQSAPVKKRSVLVPVLLLCALVCAGAVLAFALLGPGADTQKPGQTAQNPEPSAEGTQGASLPEPTEPETLDPMEAAFQDAWEYSAGLAQAGDLDGAIDYLMGQSKCYPEETRYAPLIAQLESQRQDQVFEEAARCAREHDYVQAIRLMDEAWKTTADDAYRELAGQYRMEFGIYITSYMAAGKFNSAILCNGTLEVCGDPEFKENSADGWTEITSVSMGDRFVMALDSDGRVSIQGHYEAHRNAYIGQWHNIVAISAGDVHALALSADGTVMAAGWNGFGQTEVERMMDDAGDRRIVAISGGETHSLGLLDNGRVVICGSNVDSSFSGDIFSATQWTDVAAITSGSQFCAALLTDGTVLVAGNGDSELNVTGWRDIVAIAAGDYFLVGLRRDGTVVAVELRDVNNDYGARPFDVSHLQNIIQIAAGHNHIMALDSDGILYCLGRNTGGACDFHGRQLDLAD